MLNAPLQNSGFSNPLERFYGSPSFFFKHLIVEVYFIEVFVENLHLIG
jgi:hypothetical protein